MEITPHLLAQLLATPPSEYRPQPLWVWNGKMTRKRIGEMIAVMAEQGMGGVFIHPRPGLITEYLSAEWFVLWGHARDAAEAHGMDCHIYDENSYPSGFAGGHVVGSDPTLAGTHLERRTHAGLAHEIVPNPARPFSAWMPQVDLLHPEVGRRFLQLTHEAYARSFAPEFGKSIRFVFADEPSVAPAGGIPGSLDLFEAFARRNGYRVEPALEDLYSPSPTATATRYDYWKTVQACFEENYLKPCHDWCESRGLAFTGHFHESAWPRPTQQPSTMAALRWMQAPGNDLLGFQFKPTSFADNGIYLLNLRELDSVKRQYGRRHSLVETCGGGGYDFGPADFKPLEDFVLWSGVNLINPHLVHQSLAGARKYDWPQTIGDHAPWWRGYREQADHVARVNVLLSHGTVHRPVLVLHPSTSGWVLYEGPAEGDGGKTEPKAVRELREGQVDLLLRLERRGIGYDLGDDCLLAEQGTVEGDRLRLGELSYEVVVIPRGTRNLPGRTLALLRDFAKGGGTLISETETIALVNGRKEETGERLGDFAMVMESRKALLDALVPWVSGEIRPAGEADWGEVLCREVTLAGTERAAFLCRPFDGEASIRLDLGERRWTVIDTRTGKAGATLSGKVDLSLGPRDHRLLLGAELAKEVPPRPQWVPLREAVPVELAAIEPVGPNALVLDYCDLRLATEPFSDLNTISADQAAYRAHGFPVNPWSFSIQYRRAFMERRFQEGSGFTVAYSFIIQSATFGNGRAELELALERPWLYTAEVNGRSLDLGKAEPWFDEEMGKVSISRYVRPGGNTLRLTCRPFHILAETMPVVLLGDFALEPVEQGYRIVDAGPLQPGDWTVGGRPFDPFGLRYRFTFTLASPVDGLHIDFGKEAAASLLECSVDGEAGATSCRPQRPLERWGALAAGAHVLEVLVRGSLRNLLGPHHNDGLPGPWSWRDSPEHQPPGADYRRTASGLFAPPRITAVAKGP
ncbi:MAG: hypothetical protein GVY10_02540 [Verrucomicrobia bacterium]|jgi:hypothetical protein|nr:hypothetical protein [Verrucomicrobiota bacterium]